MQLVELNVNNKKHVDFTYELLKRRFSFNHINIQQYNLPTVEQHINNIRSGRYLCYYLIQSNNLFVGKVYIIADKNEFGIFIHPEHAYQAYKLERKHNRAEVDRILLEQNITNKKIFFYYGYKSFTEILNLRPEIKTITAKINTDNESADKGAKKLNLKPKYVYYEYARP